MAPASHRPHCGQNRDGRSVTAAKKPAKKAATKVARDLPVRGRKGLRVPSQDTASDWPTPVHSRCRTPEGDAFARSLDPDLAEAEEPTDSGAWLGDLGFAD